MTLEAESAPAAPPSFDPRRYHEAADPDRSPIAPRPPVCLYLEVTNRCNLVCATCPRSYAELEPPADMPWDLFRRIVDQQPDLFRAVLHGVGEPMLVKSLPKMVRYLTERGVYVLFNTNGTALNERGGRALIEAGLAGPAPIRLCSSAWSERTPPISGPPTRSLASLESRFPPRAP